MKAGIQILLVRKKNFDTAPSRATELAWINGLQALGYDVRLVTSFSEERKQFGTEDSIDYLTIPQRPVYRSIIFYLKLALKLYPILVYQRVDLVVLDKHTFFMAFPFDLLGGWGLRKRTRVVVDFRDDVAHRTSSRVKNYFARILNLFGPPYATLMTSGVSATTQAGIDRGNILPGLKPLNETPLFSGVDLDRFNPDSVDPIELSNVQDGTLILIYHGFMGPNRGLLELVEAIHLAQRRHLLHLVMVGDGELAPLLKERAVELGLESQITWFDPVPHSEIPRYIAACHLGVLPYPDYSMWKISSPIKLMEYLGMGKAVLLRGFQVFREVTHDLPHVYYLQDNQPQTIAEALDELVDVQASLSTFSPTHRARVKEQYTWEHQISKFDRYIQTVLGG